MPMNFPEESTKFISLTETETKNKNMEVETEMALWT